MQRLGEAKKNSSILQCKLDEKDTEARGAPGAGRGMGGALGGLYGYMGRGYAVVRGRANGAGASSRGEG